MKKALAILLVLVMCFSMLTSCGKKGYPPIADMPNPVKTHATMKGLQT